MQGKYIKVLVPGWAVMPELYPFSEDRNSSVYDFHFFSGDSAEHLIHFKDRLKILFGSPGVLHAHSMGALLSLGALNELPNVKAMIIYSGFAKFARSACDNIHGHPPEAIAAMKEHLSGNPRSLLRNFHRTMFSPQKARSSLPDQFNVLALSEGLDILAGLDTRPMLPEILLPVLVLHGKEDKIVNPEIAEELAAGLKNSRFHLIKGAGHALPFTHFSEISPLIERFLSDHAVS